jgi:hypothetical protein
MTSGEAEAAAALGGCGCIVTWLSTLSNKYSARRNVSSTIDREQLRLVGLSAKALGSEGAWQRGRLAARGLGSEGAWQRGRLAARVLGSEGAWQRGR